VYTKKKILMNHAQDTPHTHTTQSAQRHTGTEPYGTNRQAGRQAGRQTEMETRLDKPIRIEAGLYVDRKDERTTRSKKTCYSVKRDLLGSKKGSRMHQSLVPTARTPIRMSYAVKNTFCCKEYVRKSSIYPFKGVTKVLNYECFQ